MGVSWTLPSIYHPTKQLLLLEMLFFVLQDDSEAGLSVFRYLLQWASERGSMDCRLSEVQE